MRKIILSCILIILLIITFIALRFGFFGVVHSYRDIKEESKLAESKLNELTSLKATTFATTEKNLKKVVSNHSDIKKQYDLISSTKTDEQKQQLLTSGDYDLSYIWVTFGNYATENQCDLNIEVSQISENNENENYVVCDLKFTTVSSYDGAIEFINRVTQDNELGFVPENLKMHSEYKTVKTVAEDGNSVVTSKRLMLVTEFYKSNIPISKASLLKVENAEETNEEKEIINENNN